MLHPHGWDKLVNKVQSIPSENKSTQPQSPSQVTCQGSHTSPAEKQGKSGVQAGCIPQTSGCPNTLASSGVSQVRPATCPCPRGQCVSTSTLFSLEPSPTCTSSHWIKAFSTLRIQEEAQDWVSLDKSDSSVMWPACCPHWRCRRGGLSRSTEVKVKGSPECRGPCRNWVCKGKDSHTEKFRLESFGVLFQDGRKKSSQFTKFFKV